MAVEQSRCPTSPPLKKHESGPQRDSPSYPPVQLQPTGWAATDVGTFVNIVGGNVSATVADCGSLSVQSPLPPKKAYIFSSITHNGLKVETTQMCIT